MSNESLTSESQLTKAEWYAYLESRMRTIRGEIQELIDQHDGRPETLQKSYLWKALHAVSDGLSWFDYYRKQRKLAADDLVHHG